ncbi:MAG TPA: NAD(+)/NADH kinase [Vicinamibacterales bacterium]|nr:NAD(+)/NADH kinase [Vicinamibacterales bacterium]
MTPRTISRVGLVAKERVEAAASVLTELATWLEARSLQPVFETLAARLAGVTTGREIVSKEELPKACDLIVLFGGDGTLIGMARRVARAGVDVPIAGVNFGSLGFLTEITLGDLYPSLEGVLDGTAPIEERMMLHAKVLRRGGCFTDELVLNDVVITKAALSRIIELSVSIGSDRVMQVRADGLIVATPTGSTAYNLAAGGPIVQPVVDALLLTPIAPHMLTNRPLVVTGTSTISVEPNMNGNDEVFVTFDGQSGHALQADDVVTIERASRPLCLVRSAQRSYFDVLRQKLKWGER